MPSFDAEAASRLARLVAQARTCQPLDALNLKPLRGDWVQYPAISSTGLPVDEAENVWKMIAAGVAAIEGYEEPGPTFQAIAEGIVVVSAIRTFPQIVQTAFVNGAVECLAGYDDFRDGIDTLYDFYAFARRTPIVTQEYDRDAGHPLIFLDFDGVIRELKTSRHTALRIKPDFNPEALAAVRELVKKYDARIVVSAAAGEVRTLEWCQRIPIIGRYVVGKTPQKLLYCVNPEGRPELNHSRAGEIASWLAIFAKRDTPFCVLDDLNLPNVFGSRFVRIPAGHLFSEASFQEAAHAALAKNRQEDVVTLPTLDDPKLGDVFWADRIHAEMLDDNVEKPAELWRKA